MREQVGVPDVWLLFAPLKKARTDFVVEKAVELGASEIRPVLTERTDAETVRVDRLQRLAFSGLSAQLVAVERTGPGHYQGTIAVENLEASQSLYLLPLDVQLYIQQGSRWNPFPARWSDNQQHVLAVEGLRPLHFDFSDTPSSHTELVPGYMHVRIDVTYAIADRPDPELMPVERRDSFFVHLLPPVPDNENVARNGFPGEPPLYIPMPPH